MSATVNYFAELNLPVGSEIDGAALERQYRELQSAWHPDRFAGGAPQEKMVAVQKTSLLNDAYRTLKSPLLRAAHLLQLKGVDVDSHDQAHLDQDFLLTQMELREALQRHIDAESVDDLDALLKQSRDEWQNLWDAFRAALESDDLDRARREFHKLQFIFKLQDEIRAAEDKLLGY